MGHRGGAHAPPSGRTGAPVRLCLVGNSGYSGVTFRWPQQVVTEKSEGPLGPNTPATLPHFLMAPLIGCPRPCVQSSLCILSGSSG